MRQALESIDIFKQRRRRLAEQMPAGEVLIVASYPETLRNGTVHHPFRQDSSLYYLTGFEEPESIFVFRPGQSPESVLFVRPKDPEREMWDGFRFGSEGARQVFQVDEAFTLNQFSKEIVRLLKGSAGLHYRFFRNPRVDQLVQQALLDYKASLGRTGLGLLPIFDAEEVLGELRLFKSQEEVENHRQACRISAEAHIEVMKQARPGCNERELQGLFIYQIMKRGAAREGYGGIFAGGASACILHYTFNDQKLKKGDLLLVDAGAEYHYFTGDITRTYPVDSKFSSAQREVYEGVLGVQKNLISRIRIGDEYRSLHEAAVQELTQVMMDLGLFTGRAQDVVSSGAYKKYFPHGLGHFLGMDVHDLGIYTNRKNEARKIQSGMVFTIEPGLYIPPGDTDAPKEFQGIGVRIEDDVLVTPNGVEVMTQSCPKEVSELESIIGSGEPR